VLADLEAGRARQDRQVEVEPARVHRVEERRDEQPESAEDEDDRGYLAERGQDAGVPPRRRAPRRPGSAGHALRPAVTQPDLRSTGCRPRMRAAPVER
jgi:hypothetical protein